MYSYLHSLIFSCISLTSTLAISPCIIDLDGPNWPAKPAILTTTSGDLVLPSGDAHIRQVTLAPDDQFHLSCPGTYLTIGPRNVWIECIKDTQFRWWEEESSEVVNTADFGELGCKRTPSDAAQIIGSCGKNDEYDLIEVGFDTSTGDLVTMVTVCHDTNGARTLYSKHILLDEIEFQDKNNQRPGWDGDFFDFDADFYYHQDQQKETIGSILGSSSLADQYLPGGEYYLARGHLAPNADYIFFSWMDATFYLINVAPQWQCFNARNWAYLEEGVREFTITHGTDYEVYTGTSGVMELEDVNGNLVEIYLYQDMLPVPKFYWKIIHNPVAGTGVAAVGVNNPHLTNITEEFIICPPLENHPLLENVPASEDISKGYLYFCRVEDLAKVVDEVPELPEMGLLE